MPDSSYAKEQLFHAVLKLVENAPDESVQFAIADVACAIPTLPEGPLKVALREFLTGIGKRRVSEMSREEASNLRVNIVELLIKSREE